MGDLRIKDKTVETITLFRVSGSGFGAYRELSNKEKDNRNYHII